jgi:hypothetical protein
MRISQSLANLKNAMDRPSYKPSSLSLWWDAVRREELVAWCNRQAGDEITKSVDGFHGLLPDIPEEWSLPW